MSIFFFLPCMISSGIHASMIHIQNQKNKEPFLWIIGKCCRHFFNIEECEARNGGTPHAEGKKTKKEYGEISELLHKPVLSLIYL